MHLRPQIVDVPPQSPGGRLSRPLLLAAALFVALVATFAWSLIGAANAEAGRIGKAKKATKQELRASGEQPVKVSCRMRGKPKKRGGRYAQCKWVSAKLVKVKVTRQCRGESKLKKRRRYRFKRGRCKVDKGATKVNDFIPAQLEKRGFESTYVFCYSNLINGYRCKWEGLNFKPNVTEDCEGRASNINGNVSILPRRCAVNMEATRALAGVKKVLSDRGLAVEGVSCRPGSPIDCEYEASSASAGWTYYCEGNATAPSAEGPYAVQPCKLHAPKLAPLKATAGPRPSFGINEVWAQRVGQLDELRAYGADTARFTLNWNGIQQTRTGGYDWDHSDQAYDQMLARGIKPLLIIMGAPCWATGAAECGNGFTSYADDAHLADWAAFAAAAAVRYPEAVAIEVWNEPNTKLFFEGGPNAPHYAKLLRTAYVAIKATNPNMTVLTAGTAAHAKNKAGVQQRYDEFIREIYERGAKTYSDGIAHHGYPGSGPTGDYVEAVRVQLANVKNVMLDFGDEDKEIWITETGVSTTAGIGSGGTDKSYTEAQQAKAFTDLYDMYRRIPGIPAVIYHRWQDAPPNSGPESGFGLKRNDGSRKPVYCALSQAVGGSAC